MKPLYYGLLKDGSLRQYENKPKRSHVEMTYLYGIGVNTETSVNTLKCGENIHKMTCNCGYDRGPKLDRLMIKMLKGD